MTPEGFLALAGATLIFALIPGPGIMAVVAQAVARGFAPAVLWTAGQVLGDMVYLLLALLGLTWLADALGEGFVVLRWIGAAYLVWMGLRAWTAAQPDPAAPPSARGAWRSFAGGTCVSLGNPKAMAFYCGFLPAFVDLPSLSMGGTLAVVAVICPIVFLVPVGYAFLAARGRNVIRSARVWKFASRGAGTAMIGAGVAVAVE
ncbi:LysE family translocator [Desulfocurvus sp. DL9XJH121]